MTPTDRKALETRAPGDKPPVRELVQQLYDTQVDTNDYYDRVQEAHDARFALWDGQSDDGRKHEAAIGKTPFPWEGASDTRLRRIESIILEQKNTCLAAFNRGAFQASGVDQDQDPAAAAKIAPLLKWLFRNRMRTEIRNELNFLLNWRLTYGTAVLWIDWRQEMRMEEKEVTLDDLLSMAIQRAVMEAEEAGLNAEETLATAMESVEDLTEKVFSEEYEPVAIEMLLADNPHLDKSNAKAMLEELQEFGETTFPNPYVHTNQPRWTACRPGFDIFWPYRTSNIQEARFVARAEILSRAELEAKEVEEGWDPKFIKFMVDKGEGVIYQAGTHQELNSQDTRGFMDGSNHTYQDRIEEYRDQYQVMHFYYRGKDKKGFPVIYRTVTSPLCGTDKDMDAKYAAYGLDEINQFDHGLIPAVEFRAEYFHRPIMEDRGISEIAWTAQNELKTQRDADIDMASMSSSPPMVVTRQRAGVPIIWGPNRQIPAQRVGSIEFVDPPKYDGRGEIMREQIEDDLANYFGLMRDGVPEDKVMLFKQVLVDDFLTSLSEAAKMTIAVYQQFGDPVTISRITNAPPVEVSPEEIRGQYDILIEFDVRDLLKEQAELKANVYETAGTLDTEGVLNRGAMAADLLYSYSPTVADRIVKDAENAAQDEIAKAKGDLGLMSQGIEPLMVPGGNFRLRAQVITEDLQKNPELAAKFQQSETNQAILQNHMQHLEFQAQQEQNKMIGKVGAKSAFDKAS